MSNKSCPSCHAPEVAAVTLRTVYACGSSDYDQRPESFIRKCSRMSDWLLSSSSAPEALAVVDGTGRFAGCGPHYSRRTPGSKTFTGVGQEVVLVTADGMACWACIRQRTPTARGTGQSRGRMGATDPKPRYIWRNMLYRNLGPHLSSDLIKTALARTYEEWVKRYGELPAERLRTEIDTRAVKSRNPGYCYKVAGWVPDRVVRGKLYLWAPELGRPAIALPETA